MLSYLTLYTLLHVVISLVGIGTGFVVMYDLVRSKFSPKTTAWFLATTVLTNVTGLGFPFEKLLPSHVLAVVSLVVLAVALYAQYSKQLAGRWRTAYIGAAFFAQWVNVFVLIVQSFLKVPALHELAPTQAEWPFVFAQAATLAAFVAWGYLATVQRTSFATVTSRRASA